MGLIAVLEERYKSHEVERAVIENAGHHMIELQVNDADWLARAKKADALLVNLTTIGEHELSRLPACRAISRYGVGYDNVDSVAAAKHGIAVITQPAVTVEEVSDHALGLWLACMRQISSRDSRVRDGGWNVETPASTRRIAGSTFGIVGFGRTGRSLARKLSGFRLDRIVVYDHHVPDVEVRAAQCEPVSFDELLSVSDTVSIHVTLNDKSRYMFSRDVLFRMKRGACLVNTSRGGILDEAALADALAAGHLHSAGLDVFLRENPAQSPLLSQPTAVLSDHSAWYSVQGQVELQRTTAESAVRYLDGDRDLSIVNQDLLQD
ncbi:MAG: C-terminal binding protein [Spirochaetaceae bacterium]|nr:MAG: C-terminal binding protein [Spirochaetaceae bacterium]